LHAIFKSIDTYAKKHNLHVYLPKIGTALYGGDLCCFKNVLSNYIFERTIVHLDERQLSDYIKTGPCQHGGYTTLTKGRRVILTNKKEPVLDHDLIPVNHVILDKMKLKLADIIQFVKDHTKPELNAWNNIHELSAAPGDFANNVPKKYQLYHQCLLWSQCICLETKISL
jgi:hypothetical protein